MFLVSNFPNVPIATTNPATESAQLEAAARVPISRPEALSKSAAERALDPERERPVVERQEEHASEEQAQEEGQSNPEQEAQAPLSWREALAQARPVMERPGSRRRSSETLPAPHPASALDPSAYQRFAAIVQRHYARAAEPASPPGFEART
ncbi:hypothetical protein [Ferrimonas balearica]|uniref:hypothetical protein n=1 Tax=Ferrimonas balearica TaxID=44012 RepID=UPI001C99B3D8|nr:hypothetical protein [Ferrimonas balearica]MBY5994025.1 hypothetical protein [Ferrimonas balearica]